jgi:ABC-type multidrug transport system ATPase subunit
MEGRMNLAIEAAGLAKDHAGERALKGVGFHVPAGTLFGIIGADGAGKSTLMDILATLSDPDSGSARVLGLDLARDFSRIRADIGYMPQRFSLYQDLSVGENLDFFADIFGIRGGERDTRMEDLLRFAALGPFRDRRAGNLSGGMKQKLALACTLIHQPRLLLLDEPTVGVDPVARRDFWRMLKALRDQGISLLVSTPYMDEAALCDRLILLHQGRILAEGAPADLVAAYPYRLFRVEGRGKTLHYPADRPPPPGFALLYPAAGSLHAAARPEAVRDGSPGGLFPSLRAAVPEAETLHPIQASVEDVFFALLSGAPGAAPDTGKSHS